MNIALQLTPNQQAELERRAASAGIDLQSFVLHAVQEKLEEQNGPSPEPLSYEQWHTVFRSWVAGQRSRNPHFDDSRESVYD
jgi:hypothetical protein